MALPNRQAKSQGESLGPDGRPIAETINQVVDDRTTNLTFTGRAIPIQPLRMIRDFYEDPSRPSIELSIVVPIMDEEDNIRPLYDELITVLGQLEESWEIIFIDDGSTDKSGDILKQLAQADPRVKVIVFRRNYGQTAAMSAGFKYSRGGVIITLDGDLQNDPAEIPKLLDKMAEGYDLVSGWRKDRQDKWLTRKLPSMIANRLINKLIEGTDVQLHDFGCTLKAYKRGIIKNIHLYGEMHRFIPVFAAWLGVKVAEIPVNHRSRVHGRPKYNLSRVSRVIFDLIVVRFFSDYLTRPIQFFGKIAKNLSIAGLLGVAVMAAFSLSGLASFSIELLLILTTLILGGSLQILLVGLLGEIQVRSYFEGQHKDHFVVKEILYDYEYEEPRPCAGLQG